MTSIMIVSLDLFFVSSYSVSDFTLPDRDFPTTSTYGSCCLATLTWPRQSFRRRWMLVLPLQKRNTSFTPGLTHRRKPDNATRSSTFNFQLPNFLAENHRKFDIALHILTLKSTKAFAIPSSSFQRGSMRTWVGLLTAIYDGIAATFDF